MTSSELACITIGTPFWRIPISVAKTMKQFIIWIIFIITCLLFIGWSTNRRVNQCNEAGVSPKLCQAIVRP